MSKVMLNMSMSLDGFIAGPNVGADLPMGKDGLRLHDWLLNEARSEINDQVAQDIFATTGAVVLGKRTFDVGIGVWKDTPFPVPCFVLTHEPRTMLVEKSGTFTFVTDGIESAVRQAKAAAGGKAVGVMGANTAQECLKARLLDEIQISLAPVLLGMGTRLFEHLSIEPIELETTRVIKAPNVTHLTFRVIK